MCNSEVVSGQDGRREGPAFVPLELLSFMRGPMGWTNRQRVAVGAPVRGAQASAGIGVWRNVVLGLLVYGPLVVGVVVGLVTIGGWTGAAIGLVAAFVFELAIGLLAAPLLRLVGRQPR